jgi:homoserine kinase
VSLVKVSDPAPAFKSVTTFAPATVANLGPGFDFLSCAIADASISLGDTVTATIDPSLPPATVSISSVTSPSFPHIVDRLSKDPLRNCALGVSSHAVSIRLAKGLPLGSGLGSSAASAAAAAAKAVNALFGSHLHAMTSSSPASSQRRPSASPWVLKAAPPGTWWRRCSWRRRGQFGPIRGVPAA